MFIKLNKSVKVLGFTAISSVLIAGSNVYAAPVQPDSTVQPGQIEKRFDQEIKPEIVEEVFVPKQAEQEQVKNASKIKFVFKKLQLTGNKAVSDEELRYLYEDKLGKQISLADVYKIASQISSYYRRKGYILSRAVVPVQRISGGIVKIRIVEGFVDNIIIEGEVRGDRSRIEKLADKIKSTKPLTSKALERYLLLVNDLPGVTASSILRKGSSATGAAEMILKIQDKKYEGALSFDNRGTKFLGPFQVLGQASSNSLIKQHEKITVRAITVTQPEELGYVDATYEHPIGYEGTTAKIITSYAKSEPGSTLTPQELEGESIRVKGQVEHPFIRSRKQNLRARLGFSLNNTDNDNLSGDLSNDKLRTINLGVKYDKLDPWRGVNVVDVEVTQGIDGLGASNDGEQLRSRVNGEHNFTKVKVEASRLQKLPKGFNILFGVNGQASTDPLLASEEFAIGGPLFGRAYDPAELTGDHGVVGKAEVQYGRVLGRKYLNSYQAYTYYDVGAVWNKSVAQGEAKKSTLAAIGAGSRFNFTENLSGSLEVAVPLTREVRSESDNDPRVFFNITNRF